MDDMLSLDPTGALLPLDRPFTRAMANAAGVSVPALNRMLRAGTVRRLVRGAYVAAGAPDDPQTRAAAVALVVPRTAIAVDRTAAWVHGVQVDLAGPAFPAPVEVLTRGGAGRGARTCGRQLTGRDVHRVGRLGVTTPLRTALDLGRLLAPDAALAAMDALLAAGSFTHTELLSELPRFAGHRGVGQLRTLAAQADGRAICPAESVLRLRWHQARLPTAVPGLHVRASGRQVRLSLAVERRQYAATLAGSLSAADLVALEGAGWRVVVLSAERVLRSDPAVWTRHLEREFHQQLLAQTA